MANYQYNSDELLKLSSEFFDIINLLQRFKKAKINLDNLVNF